MKSQDSKQTTDHKTIKKWVEDRKGKPAIVRDTESSGKSKGLLRINFQDSKEENLEDISWDEFFKTFDENNLEFLYQEKTKDGKTSRFSKFVNK